MHFSTEQDATSNKAQGQTLKRVGVYLDRPFFSHGHVQPRAGSRKKLPQRFWWLEKCIMCEAKDGICADRLRYTIIIA